jgi:hypothetical protein
MDIQIIQFLNFVTPSSVLEAKRSLITSIKKYIHATRYITIFISYAIVYNNSTSDFSQLFETTISHFSFHHNSSRYSLLLFVELEVFGIMLLPDGT